MSTDKGVVSKLKMLYEDAVCISDNLCFCKTNGYWYRYDTKLHKLIGDQIDTLKVDFKEKYIIATKIKVKNVYNFNGELLCSLGHNMMIEKIVNKLMLLTDTCGLKGVLTLNGEQLVPGFYDSIIIYEIPKIIVAEEKDNIFIYDHKGKLLINKLYDKVIINKKHEVIAIIGGAMYKLEIKGDKMVEKLIKYTNI